MIRKFTPQIPVAVQENENIITLTNDYFTVQHDKNAGGAMSSLIFKYGSGKNFLLKPMYSHVALKKGDQILFYLQSTTKAEKFSFTKQDDGIKIYTEGQYADENGSTIPVRFKQTFFYQAWGRVNVSLEIIIDEQLDKVYEIGTCGIFVPEEVDTLGVRPGCPPPPPEGYHMIAESHLRWFDLTRKRSYLQQYGASSHIMPSYFALFEKGCEGFEFWREDCGESWDRPFGISAGLGIFMDNTKHTQPGVKHIRVEPFDDWVFPLTFQPGATTFNYTLGLPFIKKKEIARKALFNTAVTSRDWPTSREEMKKLADGGIDIIRLHDDNSRQSPSWRDCYYPPYDEENMKMMDQVIEWAHEFGIKIVPYFSLKEFHPDCPEYSKNAHHWNRWIKPDGRILTEDGPYGGYMCMKSGWLEFLKSTIKRVLNNHKFDGVYYDHLWFRYCNHPEHANGRWHTDADEILDLLFWTREFVGEEGVIYLHTSACPTLIGENLANLMIIGEDMSCSHPTIDTFPPDMDFVPVTNRVWCPASPNWKTEVRESTLITTLKHSPPAPHGTFDIMCEIGAIFKKYRLNDMHLHTRVSLPAADDEKSVYINVYSDEKRVVLYCGNLAKYQQTVTFDLPADLLPAGKSLSKVNAIQNIRIAEQSPALDRFKLECQPETPGVIEFEIR